MSWFSKLVRNPGKAIVGGLTGGVVGGPAGVGVGAAAGSGAVDIGNPLKDLTGQSGREDARKDLKAGQAAAEGHITSGFGDARTDLATGRDRTADAIRTGFGTSRDDINAGFSDAKAKFNSPEIVTSRQELYNRVLGNGGFDSNTTEQMKAGVREEYGTGLRDATNLISGYRGGSGAPGLAQENIGRTALGFGEKRASDVRDIDIQNAMLKEQQQTDAIPGLFSDANTMAGLDERQGTALSGLGREETEMLANLENQTGLNLSGLSTEEATLLANIVLGTKTNLASTRNTSGIMPLLSGFAQGAGQAAGASVKG